MLVRCAVSSATTSSGAWLAAPASAASTRASASARASCDVQGSEAQLGSHMHSVLQRTRLPARRVERSAGLLVLGSKAALYGVEAHARALRPLELRHVCHECATQRALSGARQAAQRQQTGWSLHRWHVLPAAVPARLACADERRWLFRSRTWRSYAANSAVPDDGASAGGRRLRRAFPAGKRSRH
jgi:hypothetical protein